MPEVEPRNSPNATLEQAAAFLHVSPRSVQNYQDRGLLKVVRFGRRRFFRWSDLEKLAKTGVAHADSQTSG
jgi:DNA-binding transcriptional MerR regulator